MVEFVLKYDKIVTEYCVNVERPELLCNGVCYLQKQVAKTVDQDQDKTNGQPVLKSVDLFVMQTVFCAVDMPEVLSLKKDSFIYREPTSATYTSTRFQPPIFG